MGKIIKWLDGKKFFIGLGMHTIWFVANLVSKDLATPTEVAIGHSIIGGWTGVGLGHKVYKNKDKIKSTIDKVSEKLSTSAK